MKTHEAIILIVSASAGIGYGALAVYFWYHGQKAPSGFNLVFSIFFPIAVFTGCALAVALLGSFIKPAS